MTDSDIIRVVPAEVLALFASIAGLVSRDMYHHDLYLSRLDFLHLKYRCYMLTNSRTMYVLNFHYFHTFILMSLDVHCHNSLLF